jgi:uroporphyrinogen decarboxylase
LAPIFPDETTMPEPTLTSRARFLAAFAGEEVDRPPVWLMRQAGRYLPGYRAVRAQHGFWDVCRTPELSTKVALEPMALFPLDAAIVFSDILVIPEALGLDVTFGKGEGPQVGRPLRSEADLAAWHIDGAAERLRFVPEAVRHLRAALGEEKAILGFAGAPWTLFCYVVQGEGSDDFRVPRVMLQKEPELARRALAALADLAADLLEAECAAGADAVQLFDTWGGLLSREEYGAFAVPALRRITDRLRAKGRRSILFVRGGHHLLPLLGETGVDGLSLDWRTPWREARALHPELLLQGNVDPVLLFAGPAAVRARTRALLEDIAADGGRRAIVNLGHGILPGTPEESVAALVDEVVGTDGSGGPPRA